MDYKEYKDLEDYVKSLYKNNREKYYELLLLKCIYDKLVVIEYNTNDFKLDGF